MGRLGARTPIGARRIILIIGQVLESAASKTTFLHPKIQRILKIYKGNFFQIRFSIFLFKNNLLAIMEPMGVIAVVQALL